MRIVVLSGEPATSNVWSLRVPPRVLSSIQGGVLMGMRESMAKLAAGATTFGLRRLAKRPAANMPGKLALKIDPNVIAEQRGKVTQGSIMVVGTNGKTTVTNLIADALERQGHAVACNRTGANLAYGVASTLLQLKEPVEWGVFESDELWTARTLPQLRPNYLLLLNLFRDQLDRCGEIDHVQDALVSALEASPETTLIYDADDPLCAAVARRAAESPAREQSAPNVTFGIEEDLHLPQNSVADAQMCQFCSGMFEYEYRHYGQLGQWRCANCGFARPKLDFAARNVTLAGETSFDVLHEGDEPVRLHAPQAGPYMVFNTLAEYVACSLVGVTAENFQKAVDLFDPQNGRLQRMELDGRPLLLNLAKNPTGFNQNLKIISDAPGKKVVGFFINDNEADGRDISWIWDCDFEELTGQPGLVVFAGGIRKNDLQVRLKYAGIDAQLAGSADDVLDAALALPTDRQVFLMANYTALPSVRADLKAREDVRTLPIGQEDVQEVVQEDAQEGAQEEPAPAEGEVAAPSIVEVASPESPSVLSDPFGLDRPLRIVHVFPDLLNLYGDGGNVRVLERRCAWRGIPVHVERVHYGQGLDLSLADIVFLGGGPDREQHLASQELLTRRDALARYVNDGGVLLAICGGYQILGHNWLMGDESVEGLGIIDMRTERPGPGFDRLIDNVALKSPLAKMPVVGYENHAGRTVMATTERPFGRVVSNAGSGNDGESGADGVLHVNVVGTYLHGPLLGKNPEVADHLLITALERRLDRVVQLPALDDAAEREANAYMAKRLGVKLPSATQ